MAEIVVMVRFEVEPGRRAAFLELVEAHAAASLSEEPGCRRFDILLPDDAPDRVMLYEVYVDAAAFEAHRTSERIARFNERSAELLRGKEIVVGRPSPGSPAPKA